MYLITVCIFVGFAVALPVYMGTKHDMAETVVITFGVTLYHFVMRLAVGSVVNAVMKNKANPNNLWFCEKSFECSFYRKIRVRKWKNYLPTYSPQTFDTKQNSIEALVGATCQAEIVHEIIMAFSLLPIAAIPWLGGAAALISTSVLAMLFDSLFVILQRYNRPILVRVMERFQKL